MKPRVSRSCYGSFRAALTSHVLLAFSLMFASAFVWSALGFARVIDEFQSGYWSGQVHVDNDTGAFRFCSGSASYRSGIELNAIIDRDGAFAVILWKSSWNYKEADLEVRYRYNRGAWLTASGKSNEQALYIFLPEGTTSTELFKASSLLEVAVYGQTFAFDLTGTRRLLNDLSGCVSHYVSKEGPRGGGKATPDRDETTGNQGGSSGTGFYVSPYGHVVTNQHVVENCRSIEVIRVGHGKETAELLRVDRTNDLAVLKQSGIEGITAARFRSGGVRVGDVVAAFGFPLRGTLSSSGNITSGNISSLAGMNDDVRHFQITAPIQPGNSGGPLIHPH